MAANFTKFNRFSTDESYYIFLYEHYIVTNTKMLTSKYTCKHNDKEERDRERQTGSKRDSI